MNRRQIQILDRLMTDSEFYSVERLAKIFKKSKRTIYGDINSISEFYRNYDVQLFSINAKGIVEKSENHIDRELLLRKIDFYSYELNSDERTHLIIYILLFTNRPITLNYISELLFCSRATVVKNVSDAKETVKGLGININLYQNKGYILQGDEVKLRELFLTVLEKDPLLLEIFFRSSEMFVHSKSELDDIRKWTIQECIRKNLTISDNSQLLLEKYLYFLRWRVGFGKVIVSSPKAEDFQELSAKILEQVIHYDEQSVDGEINYLSILLKQLKVISRKKDEHSLVAVHLLVRVFIEEMSESLAVSLSKDTELFTNLSNHMFDILEKKYQQHPNSDELIIFMEKNHQLLSKIRDKVYVFESYIKRNLSEAELGYLALHLQASLEKEKVRDLKLNVLLVCNSGVGTSQLLKNQLKNTYGFHFLLPVSATELEEYDFQSVDLVISTVKLKLDITKPIVKISFNITQTDFAKIDQVIKQISLAGKHGSSVRQTESDQILAKIHPIVQSHDNLFEELRPVIEQYFLQQSEQKELALSDLLQLDTILLDVEVNTGVEAILQGAELLERKNYVNQEFAKAVIESIDAYGPYMLIDRDVLFPHAGFDHGAVITSFSFIRLKNPVSFKDDQSDQVDLVFTLSASDNKRHVKALFSLLDCLAKEEFKHELRMAQKPEEIMQIIKRFET